MKRALLIGGAAVALLALVVVSIRAGGREKGTRVHAEEAVRQEITQVVKASGQIDPRVKVNISAHVIGKIERLHVEEGGRIEAGEPFLELEKEAFVAARDRTAAQLEIARSRVEQARIDLADAELKLRRMRRLAAERIASSEELEAAELQHESARLGLAQAQQAVSQAAADFQKARDDLAKTTIYAPLSGRVVELNAEEGEVVVSGTMNNPGSVIGTIADLSEILAEVDVDETEIVRVELGQGAEVEVDAIADEVYQGRVVEIGSSGFSRPDQPDVTFFKVKILLAEPDQALRPGMSARASILTATSEDALVVPIQAVVNRRPLSEEGEDAEPGEEAPRRTGRDGGRDEVKVVFVVADGEARQHAVETGIADATHVEIRSGLEPGQTVVTGPYRALRDLRHGAAVRIEEEKEERDRGGERAEDEDDDEGD